MSPEVNILQVILSLILVLGLIGLSAMAFKRFQSTQGWLQKLSQTKEITLVDRMMIDAKSKIIVVQWGQKKYMVLVHANGAQIIDSTEEGMDVSK